MSNAGTVATTAAVKTKVMIKGGLVGSDLKMWWISSSLPYRKGLSCDGRGEAGSWAIVRAKAGLLYGFEEPKDAMIRDADSGSEEDRRATGMSFCVWWNHVSMASPSEEHYSSYKLQFAFSIFFELQCERCLKPLRGFLQVQKGLMWPFGGATLFRREDDLQAI